MNINDNNNNNNDKSIDDNDTNITPLILVNSVFYIMLEGI